MPKKPCGQPGCSRLVDIGDAYCPAHARAVKRERGKEADARRADRPSRKWYKRTAWKGSGGRRERQLRAEPLCKFCLEQGIERLASIADHVEPHRDDHARFWFGSLQSLCKPCHDIKKQRIEARATPGGGSKP